MKKTNPIFIKFLIAALAVYIVGSCVIMSDLYYKVGMIEHTLMHYSFGTSSHTDKN